MAKVSFAKRLGRHLRRMTWRLAVSLLICVLLVAGAYAYFTSSHFVTLQARSLLADMVGGEVEIAEAHLGLDGRLELRNVSVRAPQIDSQKVATVLHINRLIAHYDRQSLLTGGLLIRRVVLEQPVLRFSEDLDRGQINMARLRVGGSGDAIPSQVPELIIHEGRFEHGQLKQGQFRVVGSLGLAGELVADSNDLGVYRLALRATRHAAPSSNADQRSAPAEPLPDATVTGRFDLAQPRLVVELGDLPLDPAYQPLLPRAIVRYWKQFTPTGRIAEVRLDWAEQAGWAVDVALRDMAVTLPSLVEQGERLRLVEAGADLRFTDDGITVSNMTGDLEGLEHRIDAQIDGYALDAPFSVSVRSAPFEIPQRPDYLDALPAEVRKVFRIIDPVGTLRMSVMAHRRKTGGPIQLEGSARILSGTGQYFRFPYRLSQCRGLLVFNEQRIEVKSLTGQTSGGGTVTVTGEIVPENDNANIDLTISAADIPLNEDLYQALQPFQQAVFDTFFDEQAYQELVDAQVIRPAAAARADELALTELERQLRQLEPEDHTQRLNLELRRSRLRQAAATPGFQMGGHVDAVIHVRRTADMGLGFELSGQIDLKDVDVVPSFFSYPIRAESGRISFEPGLIQVEQLRLADLHGGRGLVNGRLLIERDGQERSFTPELHLQCADLKLGPMLFAAIPQPQQQWLQRADPAALLDLDGRIFDDARGEVDWQLAIAVRQGHIELPGGLAGGAELSFAPESQVKAPGRDEARPPADASALEPLKLTGITGQVELTRQDISVKRLAGQAEKATIALDGQVDWSNTDRPEFAIETRFQQMPLDCRLLRVIRTLLQPGERFGAFCDERRPEGLFDATVRFKRDKTGTEYLVDAQPHRLSFLQGDQRFALDQMTGQVVFRPGQVELRQITGQFPEGQVGASGTISLGAEPVADLSVEAAGQKVTPMLRVVLPPVVDQVIDALKIDGGYGVNLEQVLWHPGATEAPLRRLRGRIDFDEAAAQIGVAVTDVKGTLQVNYEHQAEEHWPRLRMALQAQQMKLMGRPVTRFVAKAASVEQTDQLAIPVMRGRCAGGSIGGTGSMSLSDRAYEFRLALSDVDLIDLVYPEGPPPKANDPANQGIKKGLVSASLDVQGVWADPSKLRGRGDVQIRKAVLYDLPLAWGVLQMTHLSLPLSRSFDKAMISYYIADDQVTFERLSLESPGMTLKGDGTLDYQTKELDLTLTTSNPGGLELGPMSDLISGLRDQLITIRVGGSLDQPKTQVRQFNGLTEAWEDVFGEGPSHR